MFLYIAEFLCNIYLFNLFYCTYVSCFYPYLYEIAFMSFVFCYFTLRCLFSMMLQNLFVSIVAIALFCPDLRTFLNYCMVQLLYGYHLHGKLLHICSDIVF